MFASWPLTFGCFHSDNLYSALGLHPEEREEEEEEEKEEEEEEEGEENKEEAKEEEKDIQVAVHTTHLPYLILCIQFLMHRFFFTEFDEVGIQFVIEQAGVSRERAITALRDHGGCVAHLSS